MKSDPAVDPILECDCGLHLQVADLKRRIERLEKRSEPLKPITVKVRQPNVPEWSKTNE